MITPEEARELMDGSLKYKNAFFKSKLNWMCGRLNHQIATQAASGMHFATISTRYKDVASNYYPVMAKAYEAEGYCVAYTTHKNQFLTVCWDPSKLTYAQELDFTKAEYHTPLGEIMFGRCTAEQISKTIDILKFLTSYLPTLKEFQNWTEEERRAMNMAMEIAKTAYRAITSDADVFSDRKKAGITRHYDLLEKV